MIEWLIEHNFKWLYTYKSRRIGKVDRGGYYYNNNVCSIYYYTMSYIYTLYLTPREILHDRGYII